MRLIAVTTSLPAKSADRFARRFKRHFDPLFVYDGEKELNGQGYKSDFYTVARNPFEGEPDISKHMIEVGGDKITFTIPKGANFGTIKPNNPNPDGSSRTKA